MFINNAHNKSMEWKLTEKKHRQNTQLLFARLSRLFAKRNDANINITVERTTHCMPNRKVPQKGGWFRVYPILWPVQRLVRSQTNGHEIARSASFRLKWMDFWEIHSSFLGSFRENSNLANDYFSSTLSFTIWPSPAGDMLCTYAYEHKTKPRYKFWTSF